MKAKLNMRLRKSHIVAIIMGALIWLMLAAVLQAGVMLTWENDFWLDSDDSYTDGFEIMWVGAARQGQNGVRHTGYGLRNAFYTPEDIEQTVPPSMADRPWFGYTSVQRTDWRRTRKAMQRVDWILGVSGEWSQSDHIQTWVHRDVVHCGLPAGWHWQGDSEPFVNVNYAYYRPIWGLGRRSGWSLDTTAIGGGALGTAFIHGELGASARAGWNVPRDSWAGLIKPTAQSRLSAYLFAEQFGRLVGHNISLGSLWQNDVPERELEHWVSDSVLGASVGVRIRKTDVGVSYRRVWRTDEFEGQEVPSDFGSLALTFMGAF